MRNVRIWLAAALAVLAVPATAQAADDFRAGSQDDPQADASIAPPDSGGGPGARLVDVRRVQVEYDAGVGSLTVQFDGDLNGVFKSNLVSTLNVSAPNSAGKCDGRLRPGDFKVDGYEVARGYLGEYQSAGLSDHNGNAVAQGAYENEDQTGSGPRLTFSSSSLIRRDLRCVSAVSAVKVESGWLGSSRDDVRDFFIGGPVVQPPTEAPRIGRNGATLTWNRIGSFNTYVIATSSAPEGSPGRNTTYRTVSGTTFTPPAVPGATRYYGVRVDTPDSLWANPEVGIAYAATPVPTPTPTTTPPVTNTGTSPTTTGTGTTAQPIIVRPGQTVAAPLPTPGNPVTVVQPPTPVGRFTKLTDRASKRISASLLRRAYGKRSYRLRCSTTRSGRSSTCTGTWRSRRFVYRATVIVTRGSTTRTQLTVRATRR